MAIDKKLIDQLLTDYKRPEDIIGENGLLKELTKAILERALQAEITDHLGYEKHDPAGHHRGNSRNGKSQKTLKGRTGLGASFLAPELRGSPVISCWMLRPLLQRVEHVFCQKRRSPGSQKPSYSRQLYCQAAACDDRPKFLDRVLQEHRAKTGPAEIVGSMLSRDSMLMRSASNREKPESGSKGHVVESFGRAGALYKKH
jgi:hypothetical protein